MSFLVGRNLTCGYGGADIIHDVTIAVDKGQIAVVVGPNGAGKSTAMKAMLGLMELTSGSVIHDNEDITRLSPQERVGRGMAFVPQTRNIFATLTVEENLEMGAFLHKGDFAGIMDQTFELFPVLREKRSQKAGELSGGQRQQVALGRAMMTSPNLLVLDEPTAGVSPIVMDEVMERICEIARSGVSVLMVEQNARSALEIANVGYVLVQGRNRFTDTGEALLADPEVRSSFLGG
ncbi:MAG: ABC transporter ATP-binding protein [Rhodobacteraceae bacterium]|nr:ABC transporter ATP-binding protein [Paracoccaceae bacterium]